ncbi:unnamed protein product [Protopolystoma xenopodis]|uniref:Uncharacterized protein n=1 Tax=Protopolystoma xenopodis TaxID=117903 RepID=A0A3S4ZYN6_9PLAT|nr:unnamed protein product [Protopolystoma xenopodis]
MGQIEMVFGSSLIADSLSEAQHPKKASFVVSGPVVIFFSLCPILESPNDESTVEAFRSLLVLEVHVSLRIQRIHRPANDFHNCFGRVSVVLHHSNLAKIASLKRVPMKVYPIKHIRTRHLDRGLER